MYFSSMLSVGKADNGFVIEACVPLKKEKREGKENSIACGPSSAEKRYIAKDAAEAGAYITKLLPLLDGDYKTEDDFADAFESATDTE